MRTKTENVRIQDSSFDVMKIIDEWIATAYNKADGQGVENPFNADVYADSGTVNKNRS